MPILLDEPLTYNPGSGQDEHIYSWVMITDFRIRTVMKMATIIIQYGNVVDGNWTPGELVHRVLVENIPEQLDGQGGGIPADPKFDILVGASLTSAAGVSLYNDVSTNLYQYLIDEGIYSGEIF